ncbi:MAG: hypothetical protein ACXVRK_03990 [Gaiellaceae bacterium]
MKHRLVLIVGVAVVALTVASSAFAFDCMRVSSSAQGLQQSASNSGNWLYFDMTDGGNGVAQVVDFFTLPAATVPCFQAAYDAAVAANPALPKYFALGFGVAGGKTNGPGVLAHNNPNSRVLSNGTGIDHFDDTVLPVFLAAAATCVP